MRTRLFDLTDKSMAEMATILGISLSQVYRVKQGSRG